MSGAKSTWVLRDDVRPQTEMESCPIDVFVWHDLLENHSFSVD